MDINLKGKTPKASTFEEANEIIKALWSVIQKLSERLETNNKNSSLSPSKDRSPKNSNPLYERQIKKREY